MRVIHLNILFADDDILALNRLTAIMPWDQQGCSLLGHAMNGLDCLRMVRELPVDVLFLDIDMPDLNGVEVCKTIQREGLDIKIIIISNYDSFAFVRDAMRYGALDYLLKHQISQETIKAKLDEIKKSLESERTRNTRMFMLTSIAKQQYLRELLLSPEAALKRLPEFSELKEFSSGSYVLALAQIMNFEIWIHFSSGPDREKLVQSIVSIGNNLLESAGSGLLISLEHGQFAVCFAMGRMVSTGEMLENADSHMRTLASHLYKLLDVRLEWKLGHILSELRMLPASRQALSEQMNFPAIVDTQDIGILDEKELISALSMLDYARTEALISQICQSCMTRYRELSQQMIYRLLQIGVRFQESQNMLLLGETEKNLRIRARAPMGGKEVVRFLQDYFRAIILTAMDGSNENYSPYVKKALFYIHSHYAEDISLAALAEELIISPAHLSRQFRKETGEAFIDKLIAYRIKIARHLMKTTELSLAEIAEQCGFNGYNYFLRCYKQRMGVTAAVDMAQLRGTR